MPTMRRPAPGPFSTGLEVEHRPRLAAEMFRELAPLLAKEGIDINSLGELNAPDMATLQAALACSMTTSPTPIPGPPEGPSRVRLPAGHWFGERAATDILVLAGKGRAFRALDTLMVRQGGERVLHGAALALAATATAWSTEAGTPVGELIRDIVR